MSMSPKHLVTPGQFKRRHFTFQTFDLTTVHTMTLHTMTLHISDAWSNDGSNIDILLFGHLIWWQFKQRHFTFQTFDLPTVQTTTLLISDAWSDHGSNIDILLFGHLIWWQFIHTTTFRISDIWSDDGSRIDANVPPGAQGEGYWMQNGPQWRRSWWGLINKKDSFDIYLSQVLTITVQINFQRTALKCKRFFSTVSKVQNQRNNY
jgi:hypothetical protein